MRILINVPDLKLPGGVVALFNILKMDQYYPNISLFVIHNKLFSFLRIPYKYFSFSLNLFHTDVVHLNPSLDRKSFLRDSVFAWISILSSKKLIVYWHGWDEDFEKEIKSSKFLNYIAKHTFLRAQATIVLGKLFESKLRSFGYQNKVYIETNTAESKHFGEMKPKTIEPDQTVRLLFLSRLEIGKGIYIAIETLKLLNQQITRFKVVVAGSGSEEKNIKELALKNKDIEWVGNVIEESKHRLLDSSHLMFLPSFSEGLPLTLLEGMMYGMPVVSRPVGGIPDIVKNGENGFLITSLSPKENASKILEIVESPGLYETMSINNINKSKLFEPQIVRKRIYSYYEEVYLMNN